MRNRFFIFFTTLLLISCWENKTKTQQQTGETGDSLVQAEKLVFSNSNFNKKNKIFENEVPNYSINIEVKYAEGKSRAAQLINQQLASFLFGNTTMTFEEAKNHFADSISTEFEKELRDFYDPDNEYQERYINFKEQTGEVITCNKLFGNKQDEIKKLIKQQIIKDNDCKTEEELVEKRSIFSLGDVYISDNNFLIEKDGIMFCYNPYDIAPWSEGFIFAKISYKELEGLITPNFLKN